ncbi:MAG: hypothetical protein GY895_07490 [Phycisphaera sp.]|nr:hypothetical protein [Phycisphaera sp.]
MLHHPGSCAATALLCPLLLFPALAMGAADPPVEIDAVDLGTWANHYFHTVADDSTDASTGHWDSTSRKPLRGGRMIAANATSWDDSRISGTLSVTASCRGAQPLRGQAMSEIRFTVPDRERSRPDASWGWGGASPLERLYHGTPPTCTASIRCDVRRGTQTGNVKYRLDEPHASSSSPKVAGLLLMRDGIVITECLLQDSEAANMRSLDIDLELPPGEYVLLAHCGADLRGAPGDRAMAEPSVDFEIDFENSGPGNGSYSLLHSEEDFLLDAGKGRQFFAWPSILHDTWRSASEVHLGTRADAGGVVSYQPGGLTAFRYLRAAQGTHPSASPWTEASNRMEVVFGLPSRMDVGIGGLWKMLMQQPDPSLNHGRWELVVESLDDGGEVWRQELTIADVDPLTDFGEYASWINLDSGGYRLTLVGDAIARQVNSDAELGFWLAVAFELP